MTIMWLLVLSFFYLSFQKPYEAIYILQLHLQFKVNRVLHPTLLFEGQAQLGFKRSSMHQSYNLQKFFDGLQYKVTQ